MFWKGTDPVESSTQPRLLKSELEEMKHQATAIGQAPGISGMTGSGIGVISLFASVILCGSSHLLLRGAASSPALASDGLFVLFFHPGILGGLVLYAVGTGLWIFCLSRLDLSLAFPASAVQLVIVYAGARWFLGEEIPVLRLVGAGVILAGIGLLFLEGRDRRG